MLLSEFSSGTGNHFIVMEYHWLILNRTFLVLVTENCLVGIKANGYTVAQIDGTDLITNLIIGWFSIKGNLQNPKSYLKHKYLDKIEHVDLLGDEFLRTDRANFRINYSDIDRVSLDPKKKWGMGNIPNGSKVYVHMKNGSRREFIILGNQRGQTIKNWIDERVR